MSPPTAPEWFDIHARAAGAGYDLAYSCPRAGEAWYTLTPAGDARAGARLRTLDEVAAVVAGREALAYAEGQIVTGDARRLSATIADASVDMVFADPVYQRLDDYAWLARESLRTLRPRGAVLAWCSVPKLGKAQAAMEDAGLEYVYTLFYTVVAKAYRMRWYNLFCWTTPCLWLQRPGEATRPARWMPDTYQDTIILDPDVAARLDNTVVSSAGATGTFAWNKNTGVLAKWLAAYCPPGGLVWDPFTGTGSVPVVARMTGRRFLASEIDAARAEEARARLAATPEAPITPEGPEADQLSLLEAA